MISKQTQTNRKFFKNINKIKKIFKKESTFLFYFSQDPDAIGASIALALFLVKRNKECIIFFPQGFDPNLSFLFKIAEYNNIFLISDVKIANRIIKNKSPVLVVCDTPSHFLLSDFDDLNETRLKAGALISIEIDHHFGSDSEQIFKDSVCLFNKANSTCEIIADFLWTYAADGKENMGLAQLFPRNIVLSLLVGICYDTQFGKFIVNQERYNLWFNFFSKRLKELTWNDSGHIKDSVQVFDTINKMSKAKKKVIQKYTKNINTINKIGLLIMPELDKYKPIPGVNKLSLSLSNLISDLSNEIPEVSGNIGILAYFDTVLKMYFLKIRRSYKFKKYDLRNIQSLLEEVFQDDFIGGGGHEGATSFRIAHIKRTIFVKKINDVHRKFSVMIKNMEKKGFLHEKK